MNRDHTPNTLILLVAAVLVAGLATACQPAANTQPSSSSPEGAAEERTPTTAEGDAEDVAYEPAFPTDVSAEGLDADDVAQQESHSHGGAEHAHGDGDHDHGDGDHDHGDGDHEHGDDSHTHDESGGHDDDHDHGGGGHAQ